MLDEEVADRLGLSPGERLQVEAVGGHGNHSEEQQGSQPGEGKAASRKAPKGYPPRSEQG
ncbi:hypothetical protein PABY_23680 [Pyrodictium abyssi]|uniref:SpoVT-AbrB domain-containing protein n=1 Tax=Pyrodictium abyssi TaxID=54256 RepID=A0ABM8J125_9CREN|nr:hypothetical protein PABY_23680 [Pyrodictium abyssi]